MIEYTVYTLEDLSKKDARGERVELCRVTIEPILELPSWIFIRQAEHSLRAYLQQYSDGTPFADQKTWNKWLKGKRPLKIRGTVGAYNLNFCLDSIEPYLSEASGGALSLTHIIAPEGQLSITTEIGNLSLTDEENK